jgi:hypothetical protein
MRENWKSKGELLNSKKLALLLSFMSAKAPVQKPGSPYRWTMRLFTKNG